MDKAVTTTDFSVILEALQSSFNPGEITALIATVLGASVGIAFIWWGGRKLVRAVMSAFTTGKIRF